MFRIPPELGYTTEQGVTAPGAGNNFSYTLPMGYLYKLDSVELTLTTDATVTNRSVTIRIYSVAGRNSYYSCSVLAPASVTVNYHLWAGLNIVDRSSFSHVIGSFPPQIYLQPPTKIDSSIFNIQAGDTLTNIFLIFRIWAIH